LPLKLVRPAEIGMDCGTEEYPCNGSVGWARLEIRQRKVMICVL